VSAQRWLVNVNIQFPKGQESERWHHVDGHWVDRLTGWKIREDVQHETVFVDTGGAIYDFPYFVHSLVNPDECVVQIHMCHGGLELPDGSTRVLSKKRDLEIYLKIIDTLNSLHAFESCRLEIIEARDAS
jgi:hypothetical protein